MQTPNVSVYVSAYVCVCLSVRVLTCAIISPVCMSVYLFVCIPACLALPDRPTPSVTRFGNCFHPEDSLSTASSTQQRKQQQQLMRNHRPPPHLSTFVHPLNGIDDVVRG